jgi:cysteine synthase A
LLFIVWELLPRSGIVNQAYLSPPSQVVVSIGKLISSGALWIHVITSLKRSLPGLLLAIVAGIIIGLLPGWFKRFEAFLDPLLQLFRQISAFALFPVFILFLGELFMAKIVQNVTELIGDTPLVRLNKVVPEDSAEIYVKLEYFNPGSSVKDRIALSIINEAEKEGRLKPGDTIIEATSGNTGIGIAMVAAARGYKAILVMPDTMSLERRNLLKAYGAEIVLTPGSEGMKGAIQKARDIVEKYPNYFQALQLDNPANVKIHQDTTGPEIIEAIESLDGKLDGFVAGIGTGGTITGAGEVLRRHFPDIHIAAVEPAASPVLSGGSSGPHKIQGIGAGFVPSILNTEIYNEVIQVTNEDALETSRLVAREEGILGGISSGAAIYAALQLAEKLGRGKRIVAVIPSNGERYLSTPLYQF